MVKQLCPCSPWGFMGNAEIHLQPVEKEPHAGVVGAWEEAVTPWEIHGEKGPASKLEQPVLRDCTPWKHDPGWGSYGRIIAHEMDSHCSSSQGAAAHEMDSLWRITWKSVSCGRDNPLSSGRSLK
ncbi:hypothetical protein TURU_161289 [Turdus rufiventris]|nr:hypothetical protein TURU_161289 [Turdus rufiventris]